MEKKAIIIGAGPAGLTAAYELLKNTDITPIILEKSGDIGGISKTINYKGNRMDIGGHRFFSKSDRVMNWWLNIMQVQPAADTYSTITYQRNHRTIKQNETHIKISPEEESKMMLIRKRLSRIYFLRKFFTYPIQLSVDTLRKLGLLRTLAILMSYTKSQLFPRKPEKSLEDFLINRFGVKLYLLFFKDYTEKVWGVPCKDISAEWGAQRIKGVSISKAIQHAAQTMIKKKKTTDIAQKDTETSLIEQFLYPALGPGQLWEKVAQQVQEMGAQIIMHESVKEILTTGNKVTKVVTENECTGKKTEYEGDYFFSTMPVQDLIAGMNEEVPTDVRQIAAGLQYRDFITIGVLLKKLTPPDSQKILPDTWIYIQEKDVKVGRLQIFNNWSPYMVKDPDTVWLGMEYFCNKDDEFWSLTNEEIERTAIAELEKMGLAKVEDVLDSTVQRMEKTYPAYFGTYNQFEKIKKYTDQFENLFLVGRNGMHKYNNSDHSMLTAMVAVDNISKGLTSKENIWAINTEQEYHEHKNIEKENQTLDAQTPPKSKFSSTTSWKDDSFWHYLLNERINKLYLFFSAALVIIQFSLFKYFYPFPSFINGDSYVYLKMAALNSGIDTYPIGYPRFLRLLSAFSISATGLVTIQYILLQASSLFFIITLFYFYRFSRFTKNLIFLFAMCNPVCLYLANLVSSDALFISISITWFTVLIWLVERPTKRLILLQTILIFLAFTIRNNAMYYPLITLVAMFLSKQRFVYKIAGISASVLVISTFVYNTSQKYNALTGISQFSPFSGWQIANNALHAYRYIDSVDRKPVPKRFQELDAIVRKYFDTTKNVLKYPHELALANTYYMWNKPSPLQQYAYKKYSIDSLSIIPLKNWAQVAPLYYSYGSFLIQKYPAQFIRWYLLPNAAKFYAPPVEFLENYNGGEDTIHRIAKQWFHLTSNKVSTRTNGFKVHLLNASPIITACTNALFLITFIFFIMLKGFTKNKEISTLLILITFFWVINFGFSVFAAPISLRFQVFPTLLFFAATAFFIEYICLEAFKPSEMQRPTLNHMNDLSISH